jgi:CDP-diacylglycerol--glycerol-3-phosphate 3-phosphatidyltransferase/cardiolipin synthase
MDRTAPRPTLTTLPNVLTYGRIVAIPLMAACFLLIKTDSGRWAALAVFTLACFTDWLDGYLARVLSHQSTLGRMLDPIADKLLVGTALLLLVNDGTIDFITIWAAIIILCREILVSGLRLAAIERGVVLGARELGRWKTWAQALAATIAGLAAAGAWSDDVAFWALLAALVVTWVSGLDYARVAPRVLRGEGA